MRLKQYLTEERSKGISKEQALDILQTKCKKAFDLFKKTDFVIYRGVRSLSSDYAIVSPSKFTRKSANTDNYYTLINDNSPAWTKYPKRSKSIICSTSDHMAYRYGTVYAVFPFDNAKIGVCYGDDYWSSFLYLESITDIPAMYAFNNELKATFDISIVKKYTGNIDNVKTYSELQKKFKKLDEFVKIYDSGDVESIDSDYHYSSNVLYKKFTGLLENWYSITLFRKYYDFNDTEKYLRHLLDPKKNDFELKRVGKELPNDVEVWTDADSILINNKILKNIIS